MNKKKVILIFCSSIGCCLLAFVFLGIAAVLQEQEFQPSWIYGAFGCASFPFLIAALIILLVNHKKIILWEMEQKQKKLEQKGLDIIRANANISNIEQMFRENGFVETDKYNYAEEYRYLYKKSGALDFVGIREIKKDISTNVDCMIDEIATILEKKLKPSSCVCLTMILFADELTKEDKDNLLSMNINYATISKVPVNSWSALLVVYERKSKSFYLDRSQNLAFDLHTNAIKKFKKMLKKSGMIL